MQAPACVIRCRIYSTATASTSTFKPKCSGPVGTTDLEGRAAPTQRAYRLSNNDWGEMPATETERCVDLQRADQSSMTNSQIIQQRVELPDQFRSTQAQQRAVFREDQLARGSSEAAVPLDCKEETDIGGIGHFSGARLMSQRSRFFRPGRAGTFEVHSRHRGNDTGLPYR